jgi:hypothetical protein
MRPTALAGEETGGGERGNGYGWGGGGGDRGGGGERGSGCGSWGGGGCGRLEGRGAGQRRLRETRIGFGALFPLLAATRDGRIWAKRAS